MAFITEYASKEDIEKYHLDELQKKYHLHNALFDWTHNEEKDVFLMLSRNGRGDESNVTSFLLYWKGEILFYTFSIFFEREAGTLIWKMHTFGDSKPEYKSEEDRQKWEAIHADLREALRSYGLAGSLIPDNEGFNNARFVNF